MEFYDKLLIKKKAQEAVSQDIASRINENVYFFNEADNTFVRSENYFNGLKDSIFDIIEDIFSDEDYINNYVANNPEQWAADIVNSCFTEDLEYLITINIMNHFTS